VLLICIGGLDFALLLEFVWFIDSVTNVDDVCLAGESSSVVWQQRLVDEPFRRCSSGGKQFTRRGNS
jgi:hypothetical protein